MKVYSYADARQNLARILDEAAADGEVRIRRQDGTVFSLKQVRPLASPLDVPGVDLGITRSEILAAIRESRGR